MHRFQLKQSFLDNNISGFFHILSIFVLFLYISIIFSKVVFFSQNLLNIKNYVSAKHSELRFHQKKKLSANSVLWNHTRKRLIISTFLIHILSKIVSQFALQLLKYR